MKSTFLFCFLFLIGLSLTCQTPQINTDSAEGPETEPNLYLICQSNSLLKRHGILREGSIISVYVANKKTVGRLHIISADSISLRDEDGEKDTFLLSSIRKITTRTVSQKATGATLVAIGWGGLIVSGALIATPVVDNLSMFKVLGGVALFAVSLPIEIIGMRLRMSRYKSYLYRYRILSSENPDLSRQELRKFLRGVENNEKTI